MNTKQTNKKTLKKLATYSAVAASSVLASSSTHAEVIGFDLDPDSTQNLANADELGYMININNVGSVADTIDDLRLRIDGNDPGTWFQIKWRGYNDGSVYGINKQYSSQSQIIINQFTTPAYGQMSTTTTTGTTFWTYGKPMVLSSGSSVGPSSPPENWISSENNSVWLADIYSSTITFGYWSNTTEKYLGLKFHAYTSEIVGADTLWDSTLHYGFIYMTVGDITNLNPTFTIHGWAYETTPNTNIILDPNALFSNVAERKLDNNISIYSHGRNVNVGIKGLGNTKGSITVYNSLGQQIQQETIKGSANTFGVKGEGAGVYLVKVSVDGEGSSTRKVYIN